MSPPILTPPRLSRQERKNQSQDVQNARRAPAMRRTKIIHCILHAYSCIRRFSRLSNCSTEGNAFSLRNNGFSDRYRPGWGIRRRAARPQLRCVMLQEHQVYTRRWRGGVVLGTGCPQQCVGIAGRDLRRHISSFLAATANPLSSLVLSPELSV